MNPLADWVTVAPGAGQTVGEVARALLALADPADVRTQRGGREFLVPPEVAEAYTASLAPTESKPRRGRKVATK